MCHQGGAQGTLPSIHVRQLASTYVHFIQVLSAIPVGQPACTLPLASVCRFLQLPLAFAVLRAPLKDNHTEYELDGHRRRSAITNAPVSQEIPERLC